MTTAIRWGMSSVASLSHSWLGGWVAVYGGDGGDGGNGHVHKRRNVVNGDDTEKPGWRVTNEGRDAGGTPASGCARVPGGHKPLTALWLVSSRYTHTADR